MAQTFLYPSYDPAFYTELNPNIIRPNTIYEPAIPHLSAITNPALGNCSFYKPATQNSGSHFLNNLKEPSQGLDFNFPQYAQKCQEPNPIIKCPPSLKPATEEISSAEIAKEKHKLNQKRETKEKNREAARECRKRKKNYLESLEHKVQNLY